MNRPADYLYNLLPATYRMRDAEQGQPLRELLAVMDQQGALVEANIDALYGNWFIETAEDWAVPYIAELVGYQPVHDAGRPGTGTASAVRNKVLVPRREAAHTINFRRRKGTLALLEQLSLESAGWEAVAVEGFRLLGWNQHLNHRHLGRGGTVDLRNGPALTQLGATLMRPHIPWTSGGPARTAPLGVSIFPPSACLPPRWCPTLLQTPPPAVWRRRVASASRSACWAMTRPCSSSPGPVGAGCAELRFPQPVSRSAFTALQGRHPPKARASTLFFGEGKSIAVTAWGWRGAARHDVVSADVIPADLSDWHAYKAPKNKVLVDPERGRLVFPAGQLPRGVTVAYHYGFSMDLGGGEYPRRTAQPAGAAVYRVRKDSPHKGEFGSIMGAYGRWRKDRRNAGAHMAGVIEVMDSRAYEERFEFTLAQGSICSCARQMVPGPCCACWTTAWTSPIRSASRAGTAAASSWTGCSWWAAGSWSTAPVPDAVPGTALTPQVAGISATSRSAIARWFLAGIWTATASHCGPTSPASCLMAPAPLCVSAAAFWAQCSSGGIRTMGRPRVGTGRLPVGRHGVVQTGAVRRGGRSRLHLAVRAALHSHWPGICPRDHAGEDSIFLGEVVAARRQLGCLRFCHVPPSSRTPRRFNCQPDLVQEAARAAHPGDPAGGAAAAAREALRVRPALASRRYGNPAYGRLVAGTAAEIVRGASDESELGVFHNLFAPQCAANLRARLEEYTVAGFSTGITLTS
ncbi:hypothetical protein NHF46_06750 [Arthrobacter alpinus]|nr:hypothetical protein [Arthrobacter alpinus]